MRRLLQIKLTVGVLEENLAVNTTRANKGGIKGVDLVGCHDDLDIATVVETVELVEQFEHSALNFTLATRCRLVTLGTDGVNLVNENDRGGVFSGDLQYFVRIPAKLNCSCS